MMMILLRLATADTGVPCQDVGTWDGRSCNQPLENASCSEPFDWVDFNVFVECMPGSEAAFIKWRHVSDVGEFRCDYGEDGTLVSAEFRSFGGSFCCDGNETGVATYGGRPGTCWAPRVMRAPPIEESSGCSHSGRPHGLAVLLLLVLRWRW